MRERIALAVWAAGCALLLAASARDWAGGEISPPVMDPVIPAASGAVLVPEMETGPEAETAEPPALLWPDVPLEAAVQEAIAVACRANGVPPPVALALIWTESRFQADAVNPRSGCYGLCQLNPRYFPPGLTPAGNAAVGIAYLGDKLKETGGDLEAALTAYHAGRDTGDREYARAVLAEARQWEE